MTSFYDRADPCPCGFYEKLIEKHPDKTFILFTNTPFDFSMARNADIIICTFSVGPDSLKAAVRLLFGAIKAQGEHPIEYHAV
jgi:hypothetical protein